MEHASRRILIVDDDVDLATVLDSFLSTAGAGTCVTAHSLSEVQSNHEALECDVAILDINLGNADSSGVDVARWLLANDFKGRIVFLTGHARTSPLVAEAARAIETVILSKPVPADELLRVVQGEAA